jgi:sn-glycerol 3-phosphate transport system ATP-binding protein
MTVVYVTHDQVEAMSMADRIILIREGRIEQQGSPEELYAKPATMFAARFIGTPAMNLVALEDGQIDGTAAAVIRGTRTPIIPGRGNGLTLGVRPEHLTILGDVAEGVPGTVTSAEYHGADTIVTAKVGEEQLLIRSPGQLALAVGAPVRLGWEREAAHLFDTKTGIREADALQPAVRVAAGG